MPLLVDGTQIEDTFDCSSKSIFKRFGELTTRSKHFITNGIPRKRILSENDQYRTLFVGQKEFAVISSNLNVGKFDWVASDDATTCHILVLKEPRTNTFGMVHVDGFGETENDIRSIISTMQHCMQLLDDGNSTDLDCQFSLDLFLFGGFIDDKCYSEPIASSIFDIARRSPHNINLKLACCCSLNDTVVSGRHRPIIYGVAVNLQNQALEIATCNSQNQGPDMLLRNARLMHNATREENSYNIYDYAEGCVVIEPFTIRKPSYGAEMLRLPDSVYLQYCSTSPHCESAHFVENSKNTIRFALKYRNQNERIFRGKARKWKLDLVTGKWCLVLSEIHKELMA